jgi:hypothetical protein
MFNRESAIRLLFRRPGALQSRTARWTVLVLAATGAGFLDWSAVIHLMLWSDGYKDISVIGPLFLVQGIACIVLSAFIVTAAGLLLSVNVGLFGYTESLAVPYAQLSLAVEFTAAFVLLVAACVLAFAPSARSARNSPPVPTRA